jgi:hypothetical protein
MRLESPCDGWGIEGSGKRMYFVGDCGFWVGDLKLTIDELVLAIVG